MDTTGKYKASTHIATSPDAPDEMQDTSASRTQIKVIEEPKNHKNASVGQGKLARLDSTLQYYKDTVADDSHEPMNDHSAPTNLIEPKAKKVVTKGDKGQKSGSPTAPAKKDAPTTTRPLGPLPAAIDTKNTFQQFDTHFKEFNYTNYYVLSESSRDAGLKVDDSYTASSAVKGSAVTPSQGSVSATKANKGKLLQELAGVALKKAISSDSLASFSPATATESARISKTHRHKITDLQDGPS